MSKYIFKKVNDEPFFDPNQIESGHTPKKTKNYKGHTTRHNFEGLTVEQEDALMHVIMKEGINLKAITNSNAYKKASSQAKDRVWNTFKNKIDNQALYFDTTALSKINRNFDSGVIVAKDLNYNTPVTMYFLNSNPQNIMLIPLLKEVYRELKGSPDKYTDYILNASNNANVITGKKQEVNFYNTDTHQLEKTERPFMIYDPKLSKLVKKYQKEFPDLQLINEVSYFQNKDDSLAGLISKINRLSKDDINKEVYPRVNQENVNKLKRAIKQWVDKYGQSLDDTLIKRHIRNW